MNYFENTYAHDAYNEAKEKEYNNDIDSYNDDEELLEFCISYPVSAKKKYIEVINELDADGWKATNGKIIDGINYVYLSKKVNP